MTDNNDSGTFDDVPSQTGKRRRLTPVTPVTVDSGTGPIPTNTIQTRVRSKYGVRDLLTVLGKDPNFYYRFEENTDTNLARFTDMGFSRVTYRELQGVDGVGDARVNRGSSVDSTVTVRSQDTEVVLLKQPMKWRLEDLAEKEALDYMSEKALRRTSEEKRPDELNGEVKIERTMFTS